MATVDELLAAETTESDDELSFLIDEHLRIITVPERGVVLGVEGDKDVNRVRFRMNRYYHGSDLSSFQIRINYQNADGEVNYFTVSEKTVDTDTFSFVWVVAADAVMTKGTVLFVVNCFTTDSSDVVQKAYHTTLGAASVLEGLEVDVEGNQPQIVDFLSKLKNELTVHAGAVLQQMDDYAKSAESSKTAASNYANAAGRSASSAATSETNAKTSEANAKKYADEVRTVAEGYKGWFETETALTAAVPNGAKGDWAIVGSTNSIWLWDGSANVWVESVSRIDLSDYMPLRAATADILGGIKVGNNLSIDADGKLNGAAPYALTAAKVTAALGFTPANVISSTDAPPSDVSAYPDGTLWITYSATATTASADEAVDDTDIHVPEDETVADDSTDAPEDTVQDETAVTETTTVISDDAEPEEG